MLVFITICTLLFFSISVSYAIFYCTLRMSHCLCDFYPSFFYAFGFLVFDREKKKSHCSHRFGVNVFLFCLVIVKSRFVSLSNCLSFDAHNQPIHINPNAYFIYQSKIHPFYFDMLLFPSLLFVDTTISTKPEIRAE